MAKITDEFKVAKILARNLNNHDFQPFLLANYMVNEMSLFTQDMVMEFVVALFEYQRNRYTFNDQDGDRYNTGIQFGTYMAYCVEEYKELVEEEKYANA